MTLFPLRRQAHVRRGSEFSLRTCDPTQKTEEDILHGRKEPYRKISVISKDTLFDSGIVDTAPPSAKALSGLGKDSINAAPGQTDGAQAKTDASSLAAVLVESPAPSRQGSVDSQASVKHGSDRLSSFAEHQAEVTTVPQRSGPELPPSPSRPWYALFQQGK
ncbi:hypothetical protein A0H81_13882 [Grifola frondosa]|uniref:Uncharacterized protein n=1 Tax=Grifola frondosa TaxID=5627 RepID=A0A1C7LNG5_GRIFR|nr:hypothetical protein A0H81_13882 [Grifola frondosa]